MSSNVKVKNDLGCVMIVKQDEPGVSAERITVGLNTDHRWSTYCMYTGTHKDHAWKVKASMTTECKWIRKWWC